MESFSNDVELVPSSCHSRSIYIIIWSCLTTIFACTWIAIHPNIPLDHEGLISRRLKTFVLALFTPELIVLWALRQWFASRRLAQQLAESLWTQTHGFFAIMGGFRPLDFRYQESTISLRQGPSDDVRAYLESLNNIGNVITEKEILDKSKGDALAKSLVLLQVTWFLLQILARKIQHLAITDLEIVTLAYAIPNFVTYFCWWKKPLDVTCPLIDSSRGRLSTNGNSRGANSHLPSKQGEGQQSPQSLPAQLEPLNCYNNSPNHQIPTCLCVPRGSTVNEPCRSSIESSRSSKDTPSLTSDNCHVGRTFVGHSSNPVIPLSEPSILSDRARHTFPSSNPPAIIRFTRAFRKHIVDVFRGFPSLLFRDANSGPFDPDGTYLSGTLGYEDSEDAKAEWIAAFIAVIFGAIHFLAWNSEFPTLSEQILWRISSIIITCVPVLVPTFLRYSFDGFKYSRQVAMAYQGLYIFARLYLLVQMFMALRKPNPGIYTPVHWVNYIPHF